ncbi:ribbon-helix-helix protein, CopG family [Microlunatus speluncae]|uniref:ribbon-helix-helix protein, CopG family n=1 Tax=Microlunatus speluncae TaxID=2594267 RepID=UPI0012662C1E|nr:ribbon-helix-helix protein, CopG family [Microlunatus speluncae]
MPTFNEMHGKPELDTSDEPFMYHGEELTDARSIELGEQAAAHARRKNLIPGRKSLSGGATHSPVVQFRVPAPMIEALEEQAEREGLSRSKLARKALDEYLERHAG